MTTTYKVLGQSTPAATTSTALYTVPASTQAIVSTISVCNQTSTDATFRISVSVNGATLSAKEYIAYDATVRGNGFLTFTLGISLGAADVIRIYASSTGLSFSAFGTELS
jgi:D-alanyl-D-alanine carboxypeptidase